MTKLVPQFKILSIVVIVTLMITQNINAQILWDKEQLISEYGQNYELKGSENNVMVYKRTEIKDDGTELKCESAYVTVQVTETRYTCIMWIKSYPIDRSESLINKYSANYMKKNTNTFFDEQNKISYQLIQEYPYIIVSATYSGPSFK